MRRLRIAVPGPLTGPRADYGTLIREALLGLRTLPGLELQLVDDQAHPPLAARVASALVEEGVDVVVGHFNSDCARAAMPIYKDAGVPLLLPASTAPGLADGLSTFRLCGDESRQADLITQLWGGELRARTPTVWSDGSAYGLRLRSQLERKMGSPLPEAPPPDQGDSAACCATAYLGSHVAILERMREEGPNWPGAAVCCDDCFIDAFESQARAGVWVCAPRLGYGLLLREAVAIAYRVLFLRNAGWDEYFDANGEHRQATWRMHRTGIGPILDLWSQK